MKCPSCGAEIRANTKFCEACGSQISYEMLREQEQLNKLGCPKCHSSNVQFNRENQGEVKGKNSKRIIHRTVGVCKDCGYTWYPDSTNETPANNNLKWWVLGWLFFFPAPVMVLIWRKKNTWDVKTKTIVTVVFWLLFFIIGLGGNIAGLKMAEISQTTTSVNIESNIEPTAQMPTSNNLVEEKTNMYADDNVVNHFITEYNAISKYEMSDISKGNIKTKYYGHTNECYVEMINATDAAANVFSIKINGGNDEESTERMFAVFPDFVHTLDSSISDEQIQKTISDFKEKNVLLEGYKLGENLTLTFVPNVELSKGSSSSRIDIASSTYGK